MKLNDYGAQYEPDSTMFKEEVDVITTIVKGVLGQFSPDSSGSFTLIEQKDDEAPSESDKSHLIVGFNFGDGPIQGYVQGKPSCWAVCHIADQQRFTVLDSGGFIDDMLIDDELDEEFLVLKTTAGRFVRSVCMSGFPYCETEIYLAVAKAIALMGKEDEVLQASYQELLSSEAASFPHLRQLDKQLERSFERCREPELRAWKTWHESASAAGELSLFFQ